MSTIYPNSIDTILELPQVDNNITEIGGDAINSLRGAVVAIENAIGINPQGNVADLVTRINSVIDANGNIRTSALQNIGLVSLPISNSQIGSNAGIVEAKLDLDFSTSSLNSRIASVNTDISALQSALATLSNQDALHFSGTGNRHDGYDIDLTSSIRGADDVESAINLVNNAFNEHTDGTSNSHVASAISLSNEFRNISATNVQDAISDLDEISVASIAHHQDELRATSITITDKGQQGALGNLKETLFASTIFQTNTGSATNILQVMRPNVARVTGVVPDLRALNIGSIQNLRIEAGGIDRDAIDINLSSAIPTQNIEDIIFVINSQCVAAHYPVSAYNVDGRLTIAHNMPGFEFTIQIKNDISLSAHVALGFSDAISTIYEWSGNNYSASIEGSRITDMKSFIKIFYTHSGGSTILPTLGDLSLLGMNTDTSGRILCNITNHSADPTLNGTYYITSFPDNESFILSETITAGNFDLEVPADAVNFNNATNGQIFDIFAEDADDGYCTITKSKRVEYGKLSGVNLASISESFTTDAVEWKITDANEIQFVGNDNDGIEVDIPTGFIGQLKVYAPDNVGVAIFEVTGNPSSGSRSVTVSEFSGSNGKLYLSSIHYSGNFGLEILKFVTDRRNFGGAPENFTNNTFVKEKLEEMTDDLRSNGVVRGLDLISNTSSELFIRGGRAYVEGRKVDVDTQTITVQDFSSATQLLLLDRNGAFFIKSEFDSGFTFEDLIAGDSYGDNRGYATILEFETDGLAIVDGYIIDRRLLIGNIDKRLDDQVNAINNRIDQVQNVVSGSFWGQVQTSTTDNVLVSSIGVSSNSSFTELDEVGFSSGNNLITTRRFEFSSSSVYKNDVFGALGLTHINIFTELRYTGATTGPFGTSGKLEVYIGTAAQLGLSGDQTTYEDYALVKTIDDDVLPSNTTTERYVASIPVSRLASLDNTIFDILPRVKITGSTFADGGDTGDVSPKIDFYNVRVVISSYSIAGNILQQDGTEQSLATTIGNVL
jgi:hypothetical protein